MNPEYDTGSSTDTRPVNRLVAFAFLLGVPLMALVANVTAAEMYGAGVELTQGGVVILLSVLVACFVVIGLTGGR